MTDRQILIAGNWKMNCLTSQAVDLAQGIAKKYSEELNPKCQVLIAPAFTVLGKVSEVLQKSGILLAGQDCHFNKNGAHTGDISPDMLKDVGCNAVILGHSERRSNHRETSQIVKQKAIQAINSGLNVIICIGETEDEKNNGKTIEVLYKQLEESIPDTATAENCVIAYEPVWAIGTGKVATVDDVKNTHNKIRAKIAEMKSQEIAQKMKVLYGGSVKPDNAKELLALEDVDGALIGGASLNVNDFWTIIKNCI